AGATVDHECGSTGLFQRRSRVAADDRPAAAMLVRHHDVARLDRLADRVVSEAIVLGAHLTRHIAKRQHRSGANTKVWRGFRASREFDVGIEAKASKAVSDVLDTIALL